MKSSAFAQSLKSASPSRKLNGYIDLHMHSTYSDGMHSIGELIEMGVKQQLAAMSITDHDTLDGLAEAEELSLQHQIEFITGVEISAFQDGSEIHILGYMFDRTNLQLNLALVELQSKRRIRASQIVEKLASKGVNISLDRVFEKAKGTSVGRPHIAAVMVEEEFVSNFSEAFDKYLSLDFVREFECAKPSPKQAMALIIEAGGFPVLAHPSKYNRDELIPQMVQDGLVGIETYCHGLDKKNTQRYRTIAKKHNLIFCGGSDFHCERPGMRCGVGSLPIPYDTIERMRELKNNGHF